MWPVMTQPDHGDCPRMLSGCYRDAAVNANPARKSLMCCLRSILVLGAVKESCDVVVLFSRDSHLLLALERANKMGVTCDETVTGSVEAGDSS